MERNTPHRSARIRNYLPSICTSISAEDILDDRLSAALVVEDTCWSIARDDLLARERHRWQRRKRIRWCEEYKALQHQRAEIKSLARRCGVLGA